MKFRVFCGRKTLQCFQKIMGAVRCGGFSCEVKLDACDRTAHPVLYSFCSQKLGSEDLEIKNQVMSPPENIPVRVIGCSDPFFESPENREWTCEGSMCYTLTNTDSQKLYFLLIESRGCEITFYSRTWGSKH